MITDEGTFVTAYKNLKPFKAGFDTDCHGVSFTDGEFWIDETDAQLVLDDEYKRTENPKVGDILVYRDGLGVPVHSVTVIAISDKFVLVEGLAGTDIFKHTTSPDDAWGEPADKEFWRRKRGGN